MLTRKFTMIAPALLACAVTGLALAVVPQGAPPAQGAPGQGTPPAQGTPGHGKDGGKDGSKESGPRKRPDFKTLDKNGDGFISSDEVDSKVWDRMKAMDKDGDGKISEQEFKDAAKNRGPGGKGGKSGEKDGSGGSKGGDAPKQPGA